jgi:hypothetical protein
VNDQRYGHEGELVGNLDRWTEAGLVTGGQAEAIRRYAVSPAAPSEHPFGRIGGALAALGAALLLSLVIAAIYHWPAISLSARLGIALGLAVVLLAAGAVTRRRSSVPTMDHLTGALWAGSTTAVGLLIVVIVDEGFGLGTGPQALLAGAIAAAYAVPLWQARPAGLQQVLVAGGLAAAIAGGLWTVPRLGPAAAGTGLWLLGAAWFVGVRARLVVPERAGQLLTSALILGGSQVIVFQAPTAGAVVGAVSALVLLGLSITVGSRVLLAAGGLGILAFTAQLLSTHAAQNVVLLALLGSLGVAGLIGSYALLRGGPPLSPPSRGPDNVRYVK